MSDWNRICEESIRTERKEAEVKYGIRFGQTEIYCARCGKIWDISGHHGCKGVTAHEDMSGEIKPRKAASRPFVRAKKGQDEGFLEGNI